MQPVRQSRMVIRGEQAGASEGGVFGRVDRAGGEAWGEVPEAGAQDVESAMLDARRGMREGPRVAMSPGERGHCLRPLAKPPAGGPEDLGRLETGDAGRLFREARRRAKFVAGFFRHCVGGFDGMHGETSPVDGPSRFVSAGRGPVGVVAAIMFWKPRLFLGAVLIRVEPEPCAMGRCVSVNSGIRAAAVAVVRQLHEALQKRQLRAEVAAGSEACRQARVSRLRQRHKAALRDTASLQPSGLFPVPRGEPPGNAATTWDAGTLGPRATDAGNCWRPGSWFPPLDFGRSGLSFACGPGVKPACPPRPVAGWRGDGGIGLTAGDLSAAVRPGIDTVAPAANNGSRGAEKACQRDFSGGSCIGADIARPPFGELGERPGAAGFRAANLTEAREAPACEGPAAVDVSVDGNALHSLRHDSLARGGRA